MTFPCYPKYRTSGIEWLDQVPDHWSSFPIKYMALERNSLFLDGDWIESKDISSDGIRYITTGNVGEGAYKEQGAGFISEETFHALGCTEVYEGDVLVSRLNNPIGRACVVPDLGGRVVTSVDNVIFRPDSKFDKKFIVYLFSSEEYFKHTSNLARGATMQRISRGLLGNIRVVTPSFEEQTQIARFLDHETARIDALIEEQQRLIELLKEKRQAVISHAVTKGLDPTVPMKDSGVEWLGEVPAHWACGALARVADRVVVGIAEAATHAYAEQGVPILRATNIRPGKIIGELLYVNDDFADGLGSKLMRAGDLVTVRTGNAGVTAVVPEDLDGCQCFTMLITTLSKSGDSEYYCLLLNSHYAKTYFNLEGWGTAQVNISVPILKWLPVPIPPLDEQQEISKYLRGEMLKIDALIDSASEVSGLLSERRSALISAAVTGKIDVRGWQPSDSTQVPKSAVAEAV
ncbi:restriction endonuclease subunit S [Pseudomonas aeruginosa]|uniref:restriction endonuclease subunit S n=1 Tax=Pseudomonas aeruginosa TaxID=287 RepID=UPI0028FFF96F|nr:restriction endonuclease subunit S [Pseudomonas aeruginosa]MDU0583493.1 restriction endonuclease subunit S [Pseudomonas aeruginosa]MDU0721558.1 restriction endonuclease subunit S [Pseudomonas aeruginosa]